MDETALYDALRECVNRQVLVPDPTAGLERYAFRHALLQEAVYDDLLPGRADAAALGVRPDARGQLRPATRRTRPSSPITGTRPTTCRGPSRRRSRPARPPSARYAFPEALAQYERAIELWDQVPDAEARAGRDRVDLLASARRRRPLPRAGAGRRRTSRPRSGSSTRPADPVRAGLLNERLGRYAWIAGQGELAEAGATGPRCA